MTENARIVSIDGWEKSSKSGNGGNCVETKIVYSSK